MIVFYDIKSGNCMLAIDCGPSDIAVEDNKAYWSGQVVNNDMTISAYAEVPKQSIYTESVDEMGMPDQIPKLFSELTQGIVEPTIEERLKVAEDALLELLGG
jgi:hypothetical protein